VIYLKLINANLGKLTDVTFGYNWIVANRADVKLFCKVIKFVSINIYNLTDELLITYFFDILKVIKSMKIRYTEQATQDGR
jgi:hypothetical protein